MRHITWLALLIWGLGTVGCGVDEGHRELDEDVPAPSLDWATDEQRSEGAVVPYSYIVAFREKSVTLGAGSSPRHIFSESLALTNLLARTSAVRSHRMISRLNMTYPGRSFDDGKKISPSPFLLQNPTGSEDYTRLTEVQFKSEDEARRVLAAWKTDDRIWFAEPNFKRGLNDAFDDQIIQDFGDNTSTPWLTQVGFVEAIQRLSTIANKPVPLLAVMDSGVDVSHPQLQDAIFVNSEGQNKLCRGDIYGCNTTTAEKEVLGDGNVFPTGTGGFGETCPGQGSQCEHGTHVAGIMAARGSSDYSGLCPYCQLLVVKVVEVEKGANGEESFPIKDSSILAGLAYISGFKSDGQPLVRVINASFGKFERSRSVELFVKALKNFGKGTLMVAAAGNEDTMKRQYPAGFSDVLSVANVQSDEGNPQKSRSSNFGMWVDIAAPGDGSCISFDSSSGILSSIPGNGSACRTGTSMATPVVAGIAGLVLVQEPEISAIDLEKRLIETGIPDTLYRDGVNNSYRPNVKGAGVVPLLGSGVVNAYTALDPASDVTPSITAQRPDLVRSGCGVLAVNSSSQPFAFLMFLPMLLAALGGGLRSGRFIPYLAHYFQRK